MNEFKLKYVKGFLVWCVRLTLTDKRNFWQHCNNKQFCLTISLAHPRVTGLTIFQLKLTVNSRHCLYVSVTHNAHNTIAIVRFTDPSILDCARSSEVHTSRQTLLFRNSQFTRQHQIYQL